MFIKVKTLYAEEAQPKVELLNLDSVKKFEKDGNGKVWVHYLNPSYNEEGEELCDLLDMDASELVTLLKGSNQFKEL